MKSAEAIFNMITARLRSYGINDTQVIHISELLNEFWDAADSEARVDGLPD